MAKHRIPGLAVAVVKHGRVLHLQGYGLASVEFGIPVDKRSVFQLYSVTKIFTGVAIMKLAEQGKLSPETPVTEIIEWLPPAWKALRVRHLLTHTSGLPGWRENPRALALPEEKQKTLTAAEQIRFVAELPLKFPPGERFAYHQSGYTLLGMIVEKLAGKSFWAFLAEQVFAPLGMTSTRPGDTQAVIPRRPATAYNRQSGELQNWVYLFGPDASPAAGLNATAADLARFLVAMDQGKLLRRESLEALWTPVRLNDGTVKEYGLGWTVDEHQGRKVVGHEGGGAAWIAHFPRERLSVAVLCNLNGARADEIQYGIAELYLGR
jgi:CubicO group peptidase (beta-lactamase class C family)